MKIRFHFIFFLAASALIFGARSVRAVDHPPSPFLVAGKMETNDGAAVVRFDFQVPPEHILYADRLKFLNEAGDALVPSKIPDPVVLLDKVSGHEKKGYVQPFAAELKLAGPFPMRLSIKFQGCSNSACYFPEKHVFDITASGVTAVSEAAPHAEVATDAVKDPANQNWEATLASFKMVGRKTGYMDRSDFVSFLDKSQSIHAVVDDPLEKFKSLGPLATALVILLGGIGLNLTPCVLPMIPINLAIIGAGSKARSKKRGFFLGATYGAGMAVIYGSLGLFVVLTGSKFGALQSSTWFNVAIALIFIGLSLGMFDVIDIDFSRFSGGSGNTTMIYKKTGHKQSLFAFGLGVVAALLAGACVAPVVISVLLLSASVYSKGLVSGLFLPFLLGLGMALPWPFAGAGLQYLPKPGKWMKYVKQGFGVFILLFAAYYGHLAYGLYQTRSKSMDLQYAPVDNKATRTLAANDVLLNTLRQARQEHRPVFIDFAASWCKNCVAMDETVFNSSVVTQRLADFVVVRYQAEVPNEPKTKEVLDRFGVVGLPTYVVLSPEQDKKL